MDWIKNCSDERNLQRPQVKDGKSHHRCFIANEIAANIPSSEIGNDMFKVSFTHHRFNT